MPIKSKISFVIAAGGLLIVGLLAVALFSPRGGDKKEEETVGEEPVNLAEENTPSLASTLGLNTPTVSQPPVLSQPLTSLPTPVAPQPVAPKPETRPETVKAEAPRAGEPTIVEHKVVRGDAISKIAVKYGCKVEDIYKLNDGLSAANAHKIRIGQVIKVPKGGLTEGMTSTAPKATGPAWAERIVEAKGGDTAFSLAIDHYDGRKFLFRAIMDANPDITWTDRLKGGEQIVLPAYSEGGATVEVPAEPSKPVVESKPRDSIIPPRK